MTRIRIRPWRTAVAGLLVVLVVSTATAAAATAPEDTAHHCRLVDAYRIRSCATAILPSTPVGPQLAWVLAQFAGDATTLTEAEVRAHFSAEYFTVWGEQRSPEVLIGAMRGAIADFGPLSFVGFAYPPRTHEALAIMQNAAGVRAAVAIGVTTTRPALIEVFEPGDAPPTIVSEEPYSGWFDIGGRLLFLRCTGHRSPTVIFEGGLTTDWYQLQNQVAPFTRVCSYDHPNSPDGPSSRSEHAPTPRTALDFVADLHTLLRVARVPGPYVLAGISNGGLYTQLYASSHSRQVAGLVLIDAVHPAYHQRRVAMLKPLLPPEVWEAFVRESMTLPHPLQDPEQVDIWTSEEQTRLALRRSPLRPMPLVALAHGRPTPAPPGWPVEEDERLWRQLQHELAQMVPGGRLVIATESGHDIPQEQPELVLDAIGDVVRAVRAGEHVPH